LLLYLWGHECSPPVLKANGLVLWPELGELTESSSAMEELAESSSAIVQLGS
jgi:hypothetical protein